MEATLGTKDQSLQRVIAAAQHVRMLMMREEAGDEIETELHSFVELVGHDSLEEAFETAIEILAVLPTEEIQRLADAAAASLKRT